MRKNIDLSDEVVKTLSIQAIQNGTNFKNYVESKLEEISKDGKKNIKKCKNCIYWQNGHEGYWESKRFGNCKVLNKEIKVPEFSLALGLVEGCVSVEDRCDTFEFITLENFGCVHFKAGKAK